MGSGGIRMTKEKSHTTQALRFLKEHGAIFEERPYRFVEHGGTATFAKETGTDEHAVIKTIVMEDEGKPPLIVLMHGDREVSTKELARIAGVKRVEPCSPADVQRHTGYMVGGTSPFGTRKTLPVYIEETILDLERIYINGGRRGLLVSLDPKELARVLRSTVVRVGIVR
jgi:Cys-tRNA(Pro) deacylase